MKALDRSEWVQYHLLLLVTRRNHEVNVRGQAGFFRAAGLAVCASGRPLVVLGSYPNQVFFCQLTPISQVKFFGVGVQHVTDICPQLYRVIANRR